MKRSRAAREPVRADGAHHHVLEDALQHRMEHGPLPLLEEQSEVADAREPKDANLTSALLLNTRYRDYITGYRVSRL